MILDIDKDLYKEKGLNNPLFNQTWQGYIYIFYDKYQICQNTLTTNGCIN